MGNIKGELCAHGWWLHHPDQYLWTCERCPMTLTYEAIGLAGYHPTAVSPTDLAEAWKRYRRLTRGGGDLFTGAFT